VSVFEILGAAGIVISALAYLPQVIHLAKEHCSAGISSRAWAMWLTSSLLVGALAVHHRDVVFITLQVSTLASASVIVLLAHRYRGMTCDAHAPATSTIADVRGDVRSCPPMSAASLEPVSEEEMFAVRPSPKQATPQPV
jgi:uncharacterized protein with PQ loop repeat